MSEEILKALMQLFAIISKQDAGTSLEERNYVERFLQLTLTEEGVVDYLKLFDKSAGLDKVLEEGTAETEEDAPEKKRKLTSVRDSVRTLGICKKINKTLTQKQKIVVLVRLFELINAEQKITEQRLAIVETAAKVFNITTEEYNSIETFVTQTTVATLDIEDILIATDTEEEVKNARYISIPGQEGQIVLLRIESVDLYFAKYTGGESDVNLNGRTIQNDRIYLFANGSTIRPPKGKPIYYSDVATYFMQDAAMVPLSFNVNKLQYKFPNGGIGLNEINISEPQGKLVGLMGASGAGKTTLLNVMAGMYTPSEGEVLLNGVNLHQEPEKVEGIIGYIPQDDLLIEELTVFQNLFYNAKLCFKNLNTEEITKKVLETLRSLGLQEQKMLRVGSPLDKTISGGQRKRLNIALELIREPSVLFVDEPTSGLSSRDSENVMDLLRELTLKGKLIFVVIHQPSSDIYKMFDKIIVLDTGGWQTYYGNPVEALMYFKRIDHQVNAGVGECSVCGSVNPEQIFNIVEAKVVDDYGRFTANRKISPKEWNDLYRENFPAERPDDVDEAPPTVLFLPSRIKQFTIFLTRDLLSKIGNKQYVYLNLFIAPILAFILSIIIRYTSSNQTEYAFAENDNIPAYIFMCIIVSLFIGLTVSAEEIYRDQKILKRERFLNLSRSSYLYSKVVILFTLSAFQAGIFTLIGNSILGIDGLFMHYWMMLFTVSCFANVLGLNISSAFNSPVTIYILIPVILIPQMILGGAMFDFDKLNRMLGREGEVPVLAEVMVSRWAYEGLIVNQFVKNEHEQQFYELEVKENFFDYKNAYYIPELQERLRLVNQNFQSKNDTIKQKVAADLRLLQNEFKKELSLFSKANPDIKFDKIDALTLEGFNEEVNDEAELFLSLAGGFYTSKFIKYVGMRDNLENEMQNTPEKKAAYLKRQSSQENEYLSNIVRKKYANNKLIQDGDELVQVMGPIYQMPSASGALDFRAHFYAPKKHLFGQLFDTYFFNMSMIWFMTFLLYLTLYFDLLKKSLYLFNRIRLKN